MADATPKPKTPLLIMQDNVEGYCDPVTGVCSLPDAPGASVENSADETSSERQHSPQESSSPESTEPVDQD